MSCLTDLEIIAFAEGSLPASERHDVELHLDTCPSCFGLLAAWVQSSAPMDSLEQADAPGPLLADGRHRYVPGPELELACDHESRCFTATSPAVAGSRVRLDVLVDSRIPINRIRADTDTLMQRLSAEGALEAYVVASEDERFEPGGIAVTDSPFNAVDAAGIVNPYLYILGLPTEGTRWFTQVGSGTPNTQSRFTRDADAVAGCVLAGRHVAEALTAS